MLKSKKTFWSRLFDSSERVSDSKASPTAAQPSKPIAVQVNPIATQSPKIHPQGTSPKTVPQKSFFSQIASPTATQQKPPNMGKSFLDLKMYLEGKYEFSRINGKNQIFVKKRQHEFLTYTYNFLDLNEDRLLCELFEQGFTVDAKIYLNAYLNGLDEVGQYSTYNQTYLNNFKKLQK